MPGWVLDPEGGYIREQQEEVVEKSAAEAQRPSPRSPSLVASLRHVLVGLLGPAEGANPAEASQPAAAALVECPICCEEHAEAAQFAAACGHALCTRCAVRYVREALADARTHITPSGIRCPFHSSGCEVHITSTDVARLVSPSDSRFLAERAEIGEAAQAVRRRGALANYVSALHRDLSRQPWFMNASAGLRRATPGLHAWAEQGVSAVSQRLAGVARLDDPSERTLTVEEVDKLHTMEVSPPTLPPPLPPRAPLPDRSRCVRALASLHISSLRRRWRRPSPSTCARGAPSASACSCSQTRRRHRAARAGCYSPSAAC